MSSISTAPILLSPTPTDEWAQDTTAALHSTSTSGVESNNNSDAAEKTPMVRFPSSGPSPPGGYPFSAEDCEQHMYDGGLGKSPKEVLASAGAQIIETSKWYIPQAHQALINAGQTAKAYLPVAVAAYIPGTTSGASTGAYYEVPEAHPYEHSDGLEALPGSVNEADITKLPDEKALADVSTQKAETHTTEDTAVKTQDNAEVSPLSSEVRGTQPYEHTSGVCALLGNANEAKGSGADQESVLIGVAQSPDTALEMQGEGPLKKPYGVPNDNKDVDQNLLITVSDADVAAGAPVRETRHKQQGTRKHINIQPSQAARQGPADKYAQAAKVALPAPGAVRSAEQTESGKEAGGKHKVGMKDRIKGETMVVMGKLGHKEAKVAEGKRILSGEA